MLTGWRRWWRGEFRWRCTPDWERAVGSSWPDWILRVPVHDRFHAKQGRSTGRWITPGPPHLTVYLKRHLRLPWRQRLRVLFFGGCSPAWAEASHLEVARSLGIPVPTAHLVAEWLGPRLQVHSVLAVAELTGQWAVNEVLPEARRCWPRSAVRRWKRHVTETTARLTARLHCAGWFHQDLYLCHFYTDLPGNPGRQPLTMTPSGDQAPGALGPKVHLIDWGRLRRRRWLPWPAQVKDLAQLLFSSWIEGVTPTDRWRWWRVYSQAVGLRLGSWQERCLRWWVTWKAKRYLRHNARRRARSDQPPSAGMVPVSQLRTA
jgi:heptose I phosphotransferase